MPGKTCNVRPGFIVGPGDGTDRFTYWPWRVQQGGEMVVPGTPDFYQGSEFWDLSLVDPDNRRPVDFAARKELLDRLPRGGGDLGKHKAAKPGKLGSQETRN